MSTRVSPLRKPAAAVPHLDSLKAQLRWPGEASFFWHDAHFQSEAVKVLPGEYFVAGADLLIMTTLGTCIAACQWDSQARNGDLNRFMLPEGDDSTGRYGSYAMELLINEMLRRGEARTSLEAKVFGGGQVFAGMDSIDVGVRNARLVLDYLHAERVPVVSKDALDIYPRKVCLLPGSGKAMVMRLAPTHVAALLAQERLAAQRATPIATGGGSVELY